MVQNILFGILAFAALLFYAWAEGLWSWTRPDKGLIDLEVKPDLVAKQEITTDFNYVKGTTK